MDVKGNKKIKQITVTKQGIKCEDRIDRRG
jgi:hypothetical protein